MTDEAQLRSPPILLVGLRSIGQYSRVRWLWGSSMANFLKVVLVSLGLQLNLWLMDDRACPRACRIASLSHAPICGVARLPPLGYPGRGECAAYSTQLIGRS